MPSLQTVLREYLRVLDEHKSPAPKVLVGLDPATEWKALSLPAEVTAFEDLRTYFSLVNGYDDQACDELGLFEPPLAWDMHPLSLQDSLEHHEMAGENPEYWPSGFLPLLTDGGGSYVVVNCIATSPTHGAVYDMSEGVGCTRIANSLAEFFAASTQEVAQGLRNYSEEDSPTVSTREYLAKAAPLFGNSPYFTRERMDQPVIDWNKGSSSPPNESKAPRSPAASSAAPEIQRWAEIAGVPPPVEDGKYLIQLSTAPVEQWFFDKSKLAPDTTSIEANIRHSGWTVKLTRQDRLFLVTWSSDGAISVNSAQLKYQRMVRWPPLPAIENFPAMVKQLEGLIGVQFIPYADVTVPYTEKQKLAASPTLQAWLAPCASKVGRYTGKG